MEQSDLAFRTAPQSQCFISANNKLLLPQEQVQNPVRFSSFLSVHEKRQPNISIMFHRHRENSKMPSLQSRMQWQVHER